MNTFLVFTAAALMYVCILPFVYSYDPHGSTGCFTLRNWEGSALRKYCWRYCSGSSGPFCYTTKSCDNHCYWKTTCAGLPCEPHHVDCVETCAGPDPTDCSNNTTALSNAKGDTLIACEQNTINLQCPTNKTINIIGANYGRTESGDIVCPHKSIRTTKCYSQNSKSKVDERCRGKQRCELEASNSAFGGDPCIYTYKYLEVQFGCV